MPNTHLMIDIETGGTGPRSWVLTVGLLEFDPLGDGSEDVGWHFAMPTVENKNRDLDINTLKWWMAQEPDAIKNSWLEPRSYRISPPQAPQPVPDANWLDTLRGCTTKAEHIWANDPDFDCTIMRDLVAERFRWPFGKHRSMRTIKALYEIPEIKNTLAHDALADCRYQAAQVRAVYQGNAPWRA